MRGARDWYIVRLMTAALVSGSLLLSSCQSLELVDEGLFDSEPNAPTPAPNGTTVRDLAHAIDHLERHIDTYGSVTLKQPDVWGQSRLTMIRGEFECVMKKDLTAFNETLQGTFSASDQAYFLNALALSAAASGTQQVLRPAPTAVANVSSATGSTSAQPTTISPQSLPQFPGITDSVNPFGGINRSNITTPGFLGFGNMNAIALEPTIIEAQKARFLNALHELRRINEGDDTADSPGYSLNLVRLPVSIFPGKRTDIGFGAEMTLTMTPQLSDELLPMTFRNLVLNDLVDQIGFPAAQFVNNPDNALYLDPKRYSDLVDLLRATDELSASDLDAGDTPRADVIQTLEASRTKLSLDPILTRPEWQWLNEFLRSWPPNGVIRADLAGKAVSPYIQEKNLGSPVPLSQRPGERDEDWRGRKKQTLDDVHKYAISSSLMRSFHTRTLQLPSMVPATKSRRARMPFPPTQMPDIYGNEMVFQIASKVYSVFSQEAFTRPYQNPNQIVIHLPDVQGFLQEELAAVQKLLEKNPDLLVQFCGPELVNEVRNHASKALFIRRQRFHDALQLKTQSTEILITPSVEALTWAWIVESALLTDQLLLDMKEAAAAKGYPEPDGQWQDYYVPTPSAPARQAFNRYVGIRWPIHVFALDPVQQEQNIGSTFSGSREMQLALSIGFINGQISAQNMMQYSRRVEFDAQTIDLNGTTVGFSNGENTFGWRFYPRFQTPEIESNATVFFRDILRGGPSRNDLLHQRRLEPGIRECDAIVIMPSFVPYVSVDVSTNWFSLTNPRKKDLDAAHAMRLSRRVKSIETCQSCICDGNQYRDGDVARLYAKARQLETRLPFQTMAVQVPYENTLGGFGMFNTGVTDLAPELSGWYGAPSITPNLPTTLFLVGNHFSVLQTTITAGGQPVALTQLLSRQVMQVTIPPSTITTTFNGEQVVDIQVATPYGVTQHLMVPVCDTPPQKPATGYAAPPAAVSPCAAIASAIANQSQNNASQNTTSQTTSSQNDASQKSTTQTDASQKTPSQSNSTSDQSNSKGTTNQGAGQSSGSPATGKGSSTNGKSNDSGGSTTPGSTYLVPTVPTKVSQTGVVGPVFGTPNPFEPIDLAKSHDRGTGHASTPASKDNTSQPGAPVTASFDVTPAR